MDWKVFIAVTTTAFLAELGDKSQVLTLLYATDKQTNPWLVFVGVSCALVFATGIGVLAGSFLANFVSQKLLAWGAGVGFLSIGVFTLIKASQL